MFKEINLIEKLNQHLKTQSKDFEVCVGGSFALKHCYDLYKGQVNDIDIFIIPPVGLSAEAVKTTISYACGKFFEAEGEVGNINGYKNLYFQYAEKYIFQDIVFNILVLQDENVFINNNDELRKFKTLCFKDTSVFVVPLSLIIKAKRQYFRKKDLEHFSDISKNLTDLCLGINDMASKV
jgi:hypothetical protein